MSSTGGSTTRALAKYGSIDVPKKSLKHAVRTGLVGAATSSIGGVRLGDLSKRSALSIALVFLTFKIIIFVYVLWSTTHAETGKKFLSLLKNTDGAICKEVPQELNGVYAGDLDGRWVTDENFSQNRSIFMLEFTGKGVNNDQYKAAMQRFTLKMARYGNLSVARSPLWSMITWSSFNLVDPETKLGFFSNVDAGVVFKAMISQTVLVSSRGSCIGTRKRPLAAIFDNINKQVTLRIPLVKPNDTSTEFISPCPAQITPRRLSELFGGLSLTGPQGSLGYVDYGFDVRVISLVMGLNSGAVTTAGLTQVDNEMSRSLGLIGYIDPYYSSPPMPSPIYCVDKTATQAVYGISLTPQQMAGPEICFIVTALRYSNLIFFYPVVKQVRWLMGSPNSLDSTTNLQWFLRGGESFRIFTSCTCPEDQLDSLCNQNYFLQGLLFDQQFNSTRTVLMGLRLQSISLAKTMRVDPIGDYFLPAMKYALAIQRNPSIANTPLQSWTDSSGLFWDYSWANGKSLNQLLTDEFNKICPDGRCRMILFYLYSYQGATSMNTPINKLDLSLRQISPNNTLRVYDGFLRLNTAVQMCVDTFSQPQALALLAQAPPVTLRYSPTTNATSPSKLPSWLASVTLWPRLASTWVLFG